MNSDKTAIHVWVLRRHLLLVSEVPSVTEKYWCFLWLTFHYKEAVDRMVMAKVTGWNCSSSKSITHSFLATPLGLPSPLPPVMTQVIPSSAFERSSCSPDTWFFSALVMLWTMTRNVQHFRLVTFIPFGSIISSVWSGWFVNEYLFPHLALEYLVMKIVVTTQSMVHRLVASASPRNLLEMQDFKPHS